MRMICAYPRGAPGQRCSNRNSNNNNDNNNTSDVSNTLYDNNVNNDNNNVCIYNMCILVLILYTCYLQAAPRAGRCRGGRR